MAKIKGMKQFREKVDAALETMKTRDEAKACYDFSRDEYAEQEKDLGQLGLGEVVTHTLTLTAKEGVRDE